MDLRTAKNHWISMWEWLSQNPGKYAKDWPEWKKNGGNVENIKIQYLHGPCAICDSDCVKCPIVWDPFENCSELTLAWLFETMDFNLQDKENIPQIVKLAKQLKDMPWKETYDT